MHYYYKRLVAGCVILSVIFLIFAGWLWWAKVYQSPTNIFWGALQNNLATTSITRHTLGDSNGETVDQYSKLILGSQNVADWLTTIKQNAATVTTESIVTPTEGYLRYIELQAPKTQSIEEKINSANILGIWGQGATSANPSLASLFNEALLDVNNAPAPPVGDLSPQQQSKLINYIRQNNIFSTSFNKIIKQKVDGQRAYIYQVNVGLASYVRMMQIFSKYENSKALSRINPTEYQNEPPVMIYLAISPTSRQMIQLYYPEQNFRENYSSYDVNTPIALPKQTIPFSDLESRLQTL